MFAGERKERESWEKQETKQKRDKRESEKGLITRLGYGNVR